MRDNIKTIVLRGGAPWGFRVSGGGKIPIYISKVRSDSKAALGGLTPGDTLVSLNGISSLQKSLREINDVIDTVRDQIILEVQNSTNPRGLRLDSSSSLGTRENSPHRSVHSFNPQLKKMDYYQYNTSSYPTYTSTSGFNQNNQNNQNKDTRYMDSYGRSIANPLPSIFRTAAAAANSPSTASRGQQFSYYPTTPSNTYDTPRNYNTGMASGYMSDTNDIQRSSFSMRPTGGNNSNYGHSANTPNQQSYYQPSAPKYNTKIVSGNDQNYFSDSECVGSGPRFTKISRQANAVRRPSNIVLPIRSVTSKAYDEYVQPEAPRTQQQPFDVYRYQQEQQNLERERRDREQREQQQKQPYQQGATNNAPRFRMPSHITLPNYERRRRSDTSIDHEIGAELLKSPIANKKRYADSSFFKTPYNTYPTIEEQKLMARKIAAILEGGDPTQKGATKFERQRQRADKYTLECEAPTPTTTASSYRTLRSLHNNDLSFSNQQRIVHDTTGVPDCIKSSLNEAQDMNPLRIVAAPDDFKQYHMQEHVTHTNVPPKVAMSLVDDLNNNRGKGAALFQKRKARSEKWVVDENNVRKSGYIPTPSYIGPATTPWGQHAPMSWSADEAPYAGPPAHTPVTPKIEVPKLPVVPDLILSPLPSKSVPEFGDFNAKPKGFGTHSGTDDQPSLPSRENLDSRNRTNSNVESNFIETITDSNVRNAVPQPWSPSYNNQSVFSSNQQQTEEYFKYPTDNIVSKWKNQSYSPWNQQHSQELQQQQMPRSHEGIDQLRQRLMQQSQPTTGQHYKQNVTYSQRSGNNASYKTFPSSQSSIQQHTQRFTDV